MQLRTIKPPIGGANMTLLNDSRIDISTV